MLPADQEHLRHPCSTTWLTREFARAVVGGDLIELGEQNRLDGPATRLHEHQRGGGPSGASPYLERWATDSVEAALLQDWWAVGDDLREAIAVAGYRPR